MVFSCYSSFYHYPRTNYLCVSERILIETYNTMGFANILHYTQFLQNNYLQIESLKFKFSCKNDIIQGNFDKHFPKHFVQMIKCIDHVVCWYTPLFYFTLTADVGILTYICIWCWYIDWWCRCYDGRWNSPYIRWRTWWCAMCWYTWTFISTTGVVASTEILEIVNNTAYRDTDTNDV